MLSPLPRRSDWGYCLAHFRSRISLPRKGRRVGLRIVLFEACSAFTHVTACTLALPPYCVTRLPEGFSHFVTSMTAPVASGWSISPGGACTHWKAPPYHGARQLPSFVIHRRRVGADSGSAVWLTRLNCALIAARRQFIWRRTMEQTNLRRRLFLSAVSCVGVSASRPVRETFAERCRRR